MKKSLGLFKEVKANSEDYHTEKFERGYSEMNTKIGILMMLLLVSGVFAISLVLADEGNSGGMGSVSHEGIIVSTNTSRDSGVDEMNASNISIEGINNQEVSNVLNEVDNGGLSGSKRVGFINIWKGHGWIDSVSEG